MRIILIIFIIYAVKRLLKRLFKAQIDAIHAVIPDGKLTKKRCSRWYRNKVFKLSLKDGIKHEVMNTNK